jgi:hypothetical protein
MVDGKFGPKRKLKLIWQLKTKNQKGERFQARASYTQSLFEGANLRRDLESWRGKSFTAAETKGFDVEKLIGANCQLSLKHETSKSTGRTYAKVTVVLPPNKGQALTPENYTREPWPQDDDVPAVPGVNRFDSPVEPSQDFDDESGVPF